MKQLKIMLTLFWTTSLIVACSYIDQMEIADVFSVTTEYVEATEDNPGGYWVYFYTNDEITSQIFLQNGRDGVDGLDGIDGIDGVDGVSVSITTTTVDGGTVITITQGDQVTEVFVRDGIDGVDGIDGINGIDGIDGQDGTSITMSSSATEGGWILYFYLNDVIVSQIFVADGQDGIDGLPGADGEDGIDGIDGVSTTITTETTEGGYWLIFWENGEEVTRILVENGQDGQDGSDGTDGDSVTVRTETVENGTILYITYGDETVVVFIENGEDGEDGNNGNGEWTVCIKHTISNANDPWYNDPDKIVEGNYEYIILRQTLSEFVHHTYEVHGGSATQGAADEWYDCNQ